MSVLHFGRPCHNVSRRLGKTRCEGESATGFFVLARTDITADAHTKDFPFLISHRQTRRNSRFEATLNAQGSAMTDEK